MDLFLLHFGERLHSFRQALLLEVLLQKLERRQVRRRVGRSAMVLDLGLEVEEGGKVVVYRELRLRHWRLGEVNHHWVVVRKARRLR